jgi:hypothetical protein
VVNRVYFLAKFADGDDVGFLGFSVAEHGEGGLWGLTFELTGLRRQAA